MAQDCLLIFKFKVLRIQWGYSRHHPCLLHTYSCDTCAEGHLLGRKIKRVGGRGWGGVTMAMDR
jgi:hypothetical protein